MILFYCHQIQDGWAVLEDEEARHCTQVLRHRLGDEIHLVDGRGGFYKGQLHEITRKQARLEILEHLNPLPAPPVRIHLGIAPTKNIGRFEWFLEKATELGIHAISPLLCARSERKNIRPDRLQKILISSMKQSLKAELPVLGGLQSLESFLKNMQNTEKQRFIGYCGESGLPLLREKYTAGEDVVILVGPEGDFTQEEVSLARESGFLPVSFGPSRLRTETAGVIACHTIHLLN